MDMHLETTRNDMSCGNFLLFLSNGLCVLLVRCCFHLYLFFFVFYSLVSSIKF
jgi:hypothetical protein